MLHEIGLCLDPSTQVKLRTRRRQSPGITLTDFKRELRSEFAVDAQRQNRRDWESINLPLTGPVGHDLTLQNWRDFDANYEMARDRVLDRTPAEEWRMIFKKLPP